MSNATSPTFQCDACGKQYVWKQSLSGKQVKCKCGAAVIVPAQMQTQKKPEHATASTGEPLGGIYAQALGGTSTVERALEERTDDAKGSPFIEQKLPIILLVVCGLAHFVLWMTLGRGLLGGMVTAVTLIIVQALIYLPITIAAALNTAKMLDTGFGEFKQAVFKFICIMLGPALLSDFAFLYLAAHATFDMWTVPVSYFFYFATIGLSMVVLFGVEAPAAALVVLIVTVTKIAAVWVLATIAPHAFFPNI